VADDPRAADLGRRLFYDPRASANGELSCASCHDPELDWTDGRDLAQGLGQLEIHTPSIWNAAYNRWQFWDGRADSLWAQAAGPLEHPLEMGATRAGLVAVIADDPDLNRSYTELFGPLPAPISTAGPQLDRAFVNVLQALASFERRIITTETAFDRFVRGLRLGDAEDLAALNAAERAGARLFFGSARCHLCHHGPLFTDFEFHDIRLPRPSASELEPGRHRGIELVLADPLNGSGEFSADRGPTANVNLLYLKQTEHRRGEFKTPGLRNVASTAPYMHRGQFQSLGEVLDHYSTLSDAAPPSHEDAERLLEPLNLSEVEKEQIEAFLKSLSGSPSLHTFGPP
jgi:cytochrome c peroxidase